MIPTVLRGLAEHADGPYRNEYLPGEYRVGLRGLPSVLRVLLEEDLLEQADIQPCLEELFRTQNLEMTAGLLRYAHTRFPKAPGPGDLPL